MKSLDDFTQVYILWDVFSWEKELERKLFWIWMRMLFNYKFYSFTTTGLLGVLSVISFGWYAFKKGQPIITSSKHILFTLVFTIITTMLYLGTFSILKIFFP